MTDELGPLLDAIVAVAGTLPTDELGARVLFACPAGERARLIASLELLILVRTHGRSINEVH